MNATINGIPADKFDEYARRMVVCMRHAFVAGWEAHRDVQTESGPTSDMEDEFTAYLDRHRVGQEYR
jgi:hypothetical protein